MKILFALIKKEFLQIIRDPSSILIAFILPVVLIVLFATALSLDNDHMRIGLLIEGEEAQLSDLAAGLKKTTYLDVTQYQNRQSMEKALVGGQIKAMVIFPSSFAKDIYAASSSGFPAQVQVITDAADPNTATFISSYIQSAVANWLVIYGTEKSQGISSLISIEPVVWFNPELKSRYFILPGSIATIMTLVGMMLTALVIAREWERGTMEALLTMRVTKGQLILSKYIAYYVLAMCSTILCTVLSVGVFGVPFRGSYVVYFIASSLFILTSLGQGFIISTYSKNQFLAAITVASVGLMPSMMLSGFIFEIASMPKVLQWVTYIVPARYFTPIISNLFLAGNIWSVILPQCLWLLVVAVILYILLYKMTSQRLEKE